LLLVFLLLAPLVGFLTDLQWFRSVGFEQVFLLRYTAVFWTFVGFFVLFFVLALPNLYFALRPQLPRVVVDEARPARRSAAAATARFAPWLLIPAILFGLIAAPQWEAVLAWRNAVPFGIADPVFGQDVGFYFFTLPLLEFVRGWLLGALVVIAIGVVALYVVRGLLGAVVGLPHVDLETGARMLLPIARPARAHLSVLGGLALLLIALGYQLEQYGLLFREEGVLTGIGYTGQNARLPALTLLSGIVAAAGLATLANAVLRTVWILAGAFVLWVAAAVLVGGVYPGLVDAFVVRPDELNKQRPFLERHIVATREAYRLAGVEESAFDVSIQPKPEEARREFADVPAVRLWDYRALQSTFEQLQALRQQYAFHDVDVDRYRIAGAERPVMLAARELDQAKLPREARTWVNLHLYYTHGFGAVMTPVGAVTPEGLPSFALRYIPPQGEPRLDQPRIYYGERTDSYAIVGTTQDEFDYSQERGDATTRFSGGGGVSVGTLWDRILFALRFGDRNLLFTPQISGDSRVLFHRTVSDRARLIAPFLEYDFDPYLVVADGKLYWIQDAYTTGERYPYSKRLGVVRRQRGDRIADPQINYVRNSVKVVTDAYDGSVTFYVADETDPVIRTLRGIYPTLFNRTLGDMPESLRAHLRYPEDFFRMQVELFRIFHMSDPGEFYNRVDAWTIANEIFEQGAARQPMEPYYVRTRLPGSDRSEFILFVPMTPAGADRDNMVAWIAGRADPPEYGKLRVLRFPKDRVIFGPLQVEARIEADATIRQQLVLLGGAGADVLRGNLLVLPVGDSFVYLEPLYVQAREGRIPELKRVILATQDRIVIDETFEKALDRLFGQAVAPPSPQPGPPSAPGAQPEVAELVRQASEHFTRAQEALRAGDFAAYGREIRALEEVLARLRSVTGQ
jgi:uncharacterized membrane protein (UPF0182 family)